MSAEFLTKLAGSIENTYHKSNWHNKSNDLGFSAIFTIYVISIFLSNKKYILG